MAIAQAKTTSYPQQIFMEKGTLIEFKLQGDAAD
jgi:hypothetical protein